MVCQFVAFGVVQGSSRLRGSDEKFALKCDDWVSSPSSDLSDENSRIRAPPFFFFLFFFHYFITNKLNIYYKKQIFSNFTSIFLRSSYSNKNKSRRKSRKWNAREGRRTSGREMLNMYFILSSLISNKSDRTPIYWNIEKCWNLTCHNPSSQEN